MKQKLHLSASIENEAMMESIVEELASKRYQPYHPAITLPKSWEIMDSSCVESYINGTIDISGKNLQAVHIPFISSFLFVCTKEKNHPYDLRWCYSMS